ncbi:hypothetical protein [Paenibacillus sp. MMO-58]|uniref:hypothetical protein n=1 Tax=Paenibacillus sp. MMO-58 TaxID=3081290 RepID=UPI0030184A4C
MNKRVSGLLMISCLLISMTAACGYQKNIQSSDHDYGSRKTGDAKMLGGKMYGTSSANNPRQHDNAFFEYSNKLSNEVSKLGGVGSAIVMLTDKNAYVGLALDWSAVGTKSAGHTDEQDRSGSSEGVYNHDTGSQRWDNRHLVTPYNSLFTVNDHSMLSEELKQTVAVKVRELAPAVQEVHISANMDFVNELNEYAKEAWMNHSLTPWLQDFNTLVKYQFAGGDIMPQKIKDYDNMRAKQKNGQSIIPTH